MQLSRLMMLVSTAALLAVTTACGDSDDNDENTNTPVETGDPAEAFNWSSISLRDETIIGIPEDTNRDCNEVTNTFRVTIRGAYEVEMACEEEKEGNITEGERVGLDAQIDRVSLSEARADLKCRALTTADTFREEARLTLRSAAGNNYTLYTSDGQNVCFSGNEQEVRDILTALYQLRALYQPVQTDRE